MPFAKRARITVTNESDKAVGAFYYYVDWRKFDGPQPEAGYFHAQYRQAFPCEDGKPYLILETSGSQGHFAGVSLTIHTQVAGWWGEGDDIFTIDGETTPSLWGTGSEDYFCGAWCYGDTFYRDNFGLPLRKKMNHDADNVWNVYRLHLESPIAFRQSLRWKSSTAPAALTTPRRRQQRLLVGRLLVHGGAHAAEGRTAAGRTAHAGVHSAPAPASARTRCVRG